MKVGIYERRATSRNGERSNNDGDRRSEDSNVRESESVEKATILALERGGIGDRGRRNEKERERQRGERGSTWVERGEN